MLGIPLGILIGIISGFVALLLIRTAWNTSVNEVKNLLMLTGEILAIPTFWFGGPWLTTRFLSDLELSNMLPYYLFTLACVFVPITSWPMIKMIITIGQRIGKLAGETDD